MRRTHVEGLAAQPLTVPHDTRPGVNLVGFFEGESGLGEVARRLARSLEHAGVPFAAIPYRRTQSRQQHRAELALASEAPFETNVICLNADYLSGFLNDVGVRFFANRYSIGVWFWESNVFRSQDLDALRFLDEVWVASEYVRRAVAAKADVPVHVVPLPVEAPAATPSRTRAALGLPEGFMFLFLFDFVSVERKNRQAVVEAFTRAFEPGEGPILVLKSINGRERKPRHLEELVGATTDRPDVPVLDGYLSAEERDATSEACDCYVSRRPLVEPHAELCRQRRGTREEVDDLRRVELSADESSMLRGVLLGERDEASLGRCRLGATEKPSPDRARVQVTAKRVGASSSSSEPANR